MRCWIAATAMGQLVWLRIGRVIAELLAAPVGSRISAVTQEPPCRHFPKLTPIIGSN
jgi:hypothetical protein